MDAIIASDNNTLAGMVILYNPTEELIANINSYIGIVNKLYVIDNSDMSDEILLNSLKKQPYLQKLSFGINKENVGVAEALNIGAINAINDGYHWLLTMDQDSRFQSESAFSLVKCMNCYRGKDRIGLFASRLVVHGAKKAEVAFLGTSSLKTALTSGSILNLEAYKIAGPYLKKFFIDQVDHEYSLRLRKNRYSILQCNEAVIEHYLGNTKIHKLFWKDLNITHHNYIRRYYLTRNRFAVCSKYFLSFPSYCFSLLWFSFTDIILIALFEGDKFRKFRSIIRGTTDFVIGHYGKYNSK